jgi:hypothetical protein
MVLSLSWQKATKMQAIGERLERDKRKPRMKVFSTQKLMGCFQLLQTVIE